MIEYTIKGKIGNENAKFKGKGKNSQSRVIPLKDQDRPQVTWTMAISTPNKDNPMEEDIEYRYF